MKILHLPLKGKWYDMIANDRFYDALLDKGNHAKALAVTSLKFADALLAEVDKEKGGSDD